MKKYFLLLSVLPFYFFTGCNNKADKQETPDTIFSVTKSSWQATLNDSSGKLEMKKIENNGPDSLTTGSVITYLNTANSNIKLEHVRTSNDTIYIRIADAEHLTQRMGSTGPTLYFADAVYNLTEVPGIRFVSFDFEEGDHASPGVLSRENFKEE